MLIKLQSPDCNIFIFLLSLYGKIVRMNSLVSTHIALLQDRVSSIRRGLMDRIDRNSRLIAVKGSRGVGKTNFLLDYSKEYHPQDNTCLYVNVNNLFIVNDGLFHFVEHFYKLGGKVLLLDQAHKYPEWDKELRACYDAFPDLQIIFTASSIVRIKSNAYLKGIVDMYNLSGLSFREFLELETNQTFPVYSFADMVERHEEIVEDMDNTCLYVNVNNLFIVNDGLFHFVEHFYKLGGKVLLLDQAHKYPEWDKELRACYDAFPDLQIIFTASSIVRIKSNAYLKGIVDMYNLSGLSFREFLELETNQTFPVYSFADMVERHEEIVEDILKHVRPLAYFNNYLEYGYYPIYLEEKSHIDYLLKNINLTLEFDIPYASQIELKYLVKLKQLLYIAAKDNTCNVNISKLSGLIGVSRATVLNYLNYMKNARLLTLLYDTDNDDDCGKKPKKLYIHNPNLLNAVCLEDVDTTVLRKSFFLSQLCPMSRITYTERADFLVDGKYRIAVCGEGEGQKFDSSLVVMEDMIERGKGNIMPLWLAGFTY